MHFIHKTHFVSSRIRRAFVNVGISNIILYYVCEANLPIRKMREENCARRLEA